MIVLSNTEAATVAMRQFAALVDMIDDDAINVMRDNLATLWHIEDTNEQFSIISSVIQSPYGNTDSYYV